MNYKGISLAAMTWAIAGAVSAQTAPSSDANSTQLDEVVVTAERTQTNLQRTPVAVTSLSSEALTEKGATSLLDLGAYTPGLTVSSRTGSGATQGGFTIRGMGVDALGSSPAVGIYIDDVYYPSGSANLLGFFDVDRVEVLRGPQGTLFGRNTIAGAIQYITTKPSDAANGYVVGTLGEQGHKEIGGAVGLPLTDTLAIRLSARHSEYDGFVHDQLNDLDRGESETDQARLQLRWSPSDRLTLDLKAEVLSEDSNGRAIAVLAVSPTAQFPLLASLPAQFLPPAFAALRPVAETRPLDGRYISARDYTFAGFDGPESSTFDFRIFQAGLTWDVTDSITFKSISAYSESRSGLLSDLDNTPLAIVAVSKGDIGTDLFTQEFQLSGTSFGDRLKWTTGLYYFDSQETNVGQSTKFGPAGVTNPQNGGTTRLSVQAYAVYGQATYGFTDRLSMTLGGRYSTEDVTGSYLNTVVPGVFVPPFGVDPVTLPTPLFPDVEESFENFSPSLGLNFQATPDALIYAKASRGFRAGGFALGGFLPGGALAFSPETAWTYEAGTRLQLMDGRWRLNPTIYLTDWSDIQFNAFFVSPQGTAVITRNAGDAQLRGIELETQFAATDQLLLTATAGYQEGEYKTISPGIDAGLDDDLQHLPKFKYAVGARYSIPLATGAEVVASTDYSWTDDQRSAVSDADFVTQPSYGLLSARVQYTAPSGAYALAVYGTNLTDEYYFIGGANGAASANSTGTFGTATADLGRPREIGVNLKYNF